MTDDPIFETVKRRAAYFPPDSGPWRAPEDANPGFVKGSNAIAGFGARDLFVAQIARRQAVAMVLAHHYSKRIVNNSYVHLGVFWNGRLRGVMQFGYALVPAGLGKVVAGSTTRSYLELNRMWLAESCPRNSESRAISYAVKYIRAVMPQVEFIQSFADERCGGLGVVYQACSFLYLGCHKARFYELDGEIYHDLLLTAHQKGGGRGAYLKANIHRANVLTFRQFRYVRILKRGALKRLQMKPRPYPKR